MRIVSLTCVPTGDKVNATVWLAARRAASNKKYIAAARSVDNFTRLPVSLPLKNSTRDQSNSRTLLK